MKFVINYAPMSCTTGSSNKFYRAILITSGRIGFLIKQYGKIGTDGRLDIEEGTSEGLAQAYRSLVKSKAVKGGYVIGSDDLHGERASIRRILGLLEALPHGNYQVMDLIAKLEKIDQGVEVEMKNPKLNEAANEPPVEPKKRKDDTLWGTW